MKNILITGALGGMGKATTSLLKSQGYNVFCLDICDSSQDDCFVKTDLANFKSVESAFEEISKKTNHLDAIIHFGGIYKLNSLIRHIKLCKTTSSSPPFLKI